MTKAEEYRQKAKEADESSEACRDHHTKQIYRDIAQNWREMAKQADRNGW